METEVRKSPNASLEEVSKFLQLSPRTILNFMDRGLLKPVHFGRRRFFKWKEVLELAKTGVSRESTQ